MSIRDLVTSGYYKGITNKELWNKASAEYGAAFIDPPNPEMLDLLIGMTQPESRIFEYGCSTGMNLAYLAKHGRPHVGGVDISDVAIAQGLETYDDLDLQISVADYSQPVSNSAERPDAFWDVIFTRGTLQHLDGDEVKNALLTLVSMLKPGGILAIDEANVGGSASTMLDITNNLHAHPWSYLLTEVYGDLLQGIAYPQAAYPGNSHKLTPFFVTKKG